MYDEWSGLYENGKGKLYINDGIGSVGFFARIGARPEVTVINLYREWLQLYPHYVVVHTVYFAYIELTLR